MSANECKFLKHKHKKYNRLQVRATDPKNKKKGRYWWFLCDCGTYKSIRSANVLNGRTQSCGCKRRDYLDALRADLKDVGKLRKALDLAFKAMSKPKVYRFHDNDVKAMNVILHGKTGE